MSACPERPSRCFSWSVVRQWRSRMVPARPTPRSELGQTVPFSGPVGVVGQASSSYFQALDPGGGINGRQVKLIVLSDGCSPPKTIEATRRL